MLMKSITDIKLYTLIPSIIHAFITITLSFSVKIRWDDVILRKDLCGDDTALRRCHGISSKYPCNCNECMNYRWDQCIQFEICDGFHQHNFKPGVIYQVQMQLLVKS